MTHPLPFLAAGVLATSAFLTGASAHAQVDVQVETVDSVSNYNVAAWWSPIARNAADGATYVTYLKSNPDSNKDDVWVAKRAADGNWTSAATGFLSTHDAGHTQSSIALDGDGRIHLFFAMHNGAVKYARANTPHSATGGFTQASPSAFDGGDYTYPNLATTPDGHVWLIIRDKPHGGFFHYSPSAQRWSRVSNFATQSKTTVYPDHIFAGSDGDLHIIWEWAAGGAQASRHYGCYLRYDPDTNTYYRADGSAGTVPFSIDTTDVYQPLEGSETFTNGVHGVQSAKMTLDDQNRPIITYSYSTDGTAASYQHRLARWDGSQWVRTVVEPGPFDIDKSWIAFSDGVLRFYGTLSPGNPNYTGSDDIFLRTSTDYGLTWSDPIAITNGLNVQRPVGVTVDGVDYLYLPDLSQNMLYLATVTVPEPVAAMLVSPATSTRP